MSPETSLVTRLGKFAGLQAPSSLTEKLLATLGGMVSMALVLLASQHVTGAQGALAILPSMGASAVLLFAVPHGPLSQPWPLFGGHLLSAAIGVACAQWVGNTVLAASLAVGLSIGVMHACRCVHPPGGATALAAVIGGDALHALGYGYVVMPTLLNCASIFAVAMCFNNLFASRRYPSSLMQYRKPVDNPETREITVAHIEAAMQTLDEVIDIEPQQLKYLVDRADEIMRAQRKAAATARSRP